MVRYRFVFFFRLWLQRILFWLWFNQINSCSAETSASRLIIGDMFRWTWIYDVTLPRLLHFASMRTLKKNKLKKKEMQTFYYFIFLLFFICYIHIHNHHPPLYVDHTQVDHTHTFTRSHKYTHSPVCVNIIHIQITMKVCQTNYLIYSN